MDRTASDAKVIFMAALDREPGAARAAHLDAACGDRVELRRRVEALLAAHERADEVFGPAQSPAGAASVATTQARGAGLETEPAQAAGPRARSGEAIVAPTPGLRRSPTPNAGMATP